MINKDSNKYIIIFASIMVIVVTLILSLTHQVLEKTQLKNEHIDKMSQILRSVRITTDNKNAEAKFGEVITEMYLINSKGEVIPNSHQDLFSISMKYELSKREDERTLPVYIAKIDGKTKYILSLYGTGLWGALWGYVSVDEDGNTIYGADFNHDSETPGLGAEISTTWFSDEFIGKQLFKDNVFKSIAIVKSGKVTSDKDYVDGISGGTITGKGVESMLYHSLDAYSKFLSNLDK